MVSKIIARGSASANFDRSKFVSEAAEQRCNQSLLQKPPVPERGFDINPMLYGKIQKVIDSRRWHNFCAQPEAAVMPVVREFYANAFEYANGKTFVRGCQVSFDRLTINQFYQTPDIEGDDYSRYVGGHIDLDKVIQYLCKAGTEWKVSNGEPNSFKANTIDREVKVWLHFVAAKMLPSKHISDVTKDRAILLYSIVTGKTIDIGQLIFNAIVHTARSPREGIWFPSLITALCARAGVRWEEGEELLHPKAPIDGVIIERFIKGLEDCPSSAGASSSSGRPLQPAGTRNLTLDERMERLKLQMARLISWNNAIEQRVRVHCQHMGVNMAHFPSLPQPPTNLGEAVEDESGRPLQPAWTQNLTLTERMDQLELQTDQFISYQVACNNAIWQMFQLCAQHTGVDMAQFPSLPQLPTNLDESA